MRRDSKESGASIDAREQRKLRQSLQLEVREFWLLESNRRGVVSEAHEMQRE